MSGEQRTELDRSLLQLDVHVTAVQVQLSLDARCVIRKANAQLHQRLDRVLFGHNVHQVGAEHLLAQVDHLLLGDVQRLLYLVRRLDRGLVDRVQRNVRNVQQIGELAQRPHRYLHHWLLVLQIL